MWDLGILQVVPGLRTAAPRDAATLREELAEAVEVRDAPTVVRFSKGVVPAEDIPALERVGGMDVLHRAGDEDVLIIAVGSMVPMCLDVADRLARQGVGVTVVDPRWVKPVDPAVLPLAARHRLVVVVEDGVRGGVSGAVTLALRDAGLNLPVRDFGIPLRFLDHASRAEILAEIGLTAQDVSRQVVETVAKLDEALPAERVSLDPRD
jgi:1-deoxy-D-xylulose-5-phosphate synthase